MLHAYSPSASRYSQHPKMDENFHIKSSMFGCLFSPISNHPNLDDYCLSFSIEWLMSSIIIQYWMFLVISFLMKIICCYYHPILDISCHQFLDEILDDFLVSFWMKVTCVCITTINIFFQQQAQPLFLSYTLVQAIVTVCVSLSSMTS